MTPLSLESVAFLRRLAAEDPVRPWATGIEVARERETERARWSTGSPRPVAELRDVMLPGPAGPVPARLYRPTRRSDAGLLVWLHGGSWVFGSVDRSDVLIRALAADSGCAVLAIDYRLAPEHPFPAGLEDCYAAVQWAIAHRGALGVPGARVAVGGDSAGGNLAAAVTLLTRQRQGVPVDLQVLVYPATLWHRRRLPARWDAPAVAPSEDEAEHAHSWHTNAYLGDHDPSDPSVSPLLAKTLAGLPPALMITAEYDLLRDEGERYAIRLIEEGVPVDMRRYAGMLHGFLELSGVEGVSDVAADAIACIGRRLKGALSVAPSGGRDTAALAGALPRIN